MTKKQPKTQQSGPMTTEVEARTELPPEAKPVTSEEGNKEDRNPQEVQEIPKDSARIQPKPMTAEEIKAKEDELGLPANSTIDVADDEDELPAEDLPDNDESTPALPPQSPEEPATEEDAIAELRAVEPLTEIKSQTLELSTKRNALQNDLMNEIPTQLNIINDKLHLYDLKIQEREGELRALGVVGKGGYPGNDPVQDIKNPGGRNKPTPDFPKGQQRDETMDRLRYKYKQLTEQRQKIHAIGKEKAEQLQHIQSVFAKKTGTRKGNI